MTADGIITGQDWLYCSQAQCKNLDIALSFRVSYKRIPLLLESCCELDLTVSVNLLTLWISLGLFCWDDHRNSAFSHFPPQSVNSYCNASVLVRVGWVTPVTCYLLVPKWCVLRWTANSRKIQLTRLRGETLKLSIHLAKGSLKWLIELVNCFIQPQITFLSGNLLFHNICWLFSVRVEMRNIHFLAYLELEKSLTVLSVLP